MLQRIFWSISTVTLAASAATVVHESKSGVVATKTDKVLEVLASSDVCDEGCRYYGPGLVTEKKLSYQASKNHYFKFTHVSGIKTVKFFKEVRVTPGRMTHIAVRTLTEEKDAALIQALEKDSGFDHDPPFDVSTTDFYVTERGDGIEVEIKAMTQISGVMTVFSKVLRSEMKKSLVALFQNFER